MCWPAPPVLPKCGDYFSAVPESVEHRSVEHRSFDGICRALSGRFQSCKSIAVSGSFFIFTDGLKQHSQFTHGFTMKRITSKNLPIQNDCRQMRFRIGQ